jgi:hypothetical protein
MIKNIITCPYLQHHCIFRLKPAAPAKQEKAAVATALALRCVAGEFEGISYRAAQAPEALASGVDRAMIQYYMDKVDPAAAASRVAERLRVEHEATQAEEQGCRVIVVGGREGGSVRALEKKLDEQAKRESKKRARDSEVVVTLAQTQAELLAPYAAEVRGVLGPQSRVELDGESLLRSVAKLLDPK